MLSDAVGHVVEVTVTHAELERAAVSVTEVVELVVPKFEPNFEILIEKVGEIVDVIVLDDRSLLVTIFEVEERID